MAVPGWRERGYVPDSDEEDDFSTDLPVCTGDSQQLKRDSTHDLGGQATDLEQARFLSSPNNTAELNDKRVEGFTEDSKCDPSKRSRSPQDTDTATKACYGITSTQEQADGDAQREQFIADEDSPLSSVLDDLQSELELGLQTIDEILHPRDGQHISIVSSDGFVEPQPSVESGQLEATSNTSDSRSHGEDDILEENNLNVDDPRIFTTSPSLIAGRKPTRALRQRNPIQLRPFFIEDSRNRQIFKAAGLKPPRIASPERERSSSPSATPDRAFPSPQTSRLRQGSDLQDRGKPGSSRKRRNHSTESLRTNTDVVKDISGYDPPSLNTVHRRRRVPGSSSRKRSRQNEQSQSSQTHLSPRADDSDVFDFSYDENPTTEVGGIYGVWNDLLSPPRSSSNAPNNASDTGPPKFRFPRGMTPPRIPTPVASSDVKHGVVDGHQQDSSVTRSASPEGNESLASSVHSGISADQEHEEAHIKKMARRMHGVLPAAYLRLNDNAPKPQEQSPSLSPQASWRNGNDPGRKILPQGNKYYDGHDSHDPMLEMSDEASSDIEERPRHNYNEGNAADTDSDEGVFQMESFGDAAVEDNTEIDFMLTNEKGRGRTITRPRKRQKRLGDVWGPKTTSMDSNQLTYKHHVPGLKPRRRRITDHGGILHCQQKTAHKNRTTPIRLGILDSPDFLQRQKQERPIFLRLAARRARHQKERGRKTPSYSQIRLSTAQDNEDINAVLQDWHLGKIPLNPSVGHNSISNTRRALSELSDFQQNTQPSLLHQHSSRHSMPFNTPEQSYLEKTWQSTDLSGHDQNDVILEPPVPILQKTSERPGQSRLLTTFGAVQHPRAAQIELNKRSRRSTRSLKTALSALRSNPPEVQSGLTPRTGRLQNFQENDSVDNIKPPTRSAVHISARSTSKLSRSRQARKQIPRHYSLPVSQPIDGRSEVYQPHPWADATLVGPNDLVSFQDLNPNSLRLGNAFNMTTMIGSGHFSSVVDQAFSKIDKAHALKAGSARTAEFSNPYELSQAEKRSSEAPSRFASLLTSLSDGWTELIVDEGKSDAPIPHETRLSDTKDKLMNILNYITYSLKSETTGNQIQRVREVLSHTANILSKLDNVKRLYKERASHQISWLPVLSRLTLLTFKAWQFLHTLDCNSELFHFADDRLKHAALTTISLVLHPHTIQTLRQRSQALKLRAENQIGLDDVEIESLVMISNILGLRKKLSGLGSIWEHVKEALLHPNNPSDARVVDHETAWEALFAILPFLELDACGSRPDQVQHSEDASLWELVQELLQLTHRKRTSSATAVLYFRCYSLAVSWGWTITPNTLSSMLGMLQEEICGLPVCAPFDGLDDTQAFCQSPGLQGESSISIVLKLVAKSIYTRSEDELTSNRNVSSLVAKIIPTQNYDILPVSVVQYLRLVRQQFDVLSVIYVSAPDPSKPSLRQFKRLMNSQQISIEVCQAGIDLCIRMMRYDIRHGQGTEEFARWLDEILLDIIEGWKQGRAMSASSSSLTTHQRLLAYGLSNVQDLISNCSHGSQVIRIIPQGALSNILHSASEKTALQNVIPLTINVIKEIVAWPKSECQPTSKESEDDSQDYGTVEWTAFEATDNGHANVLHHILDKYYIPIKRLLSSALRIESSISGPIFQTAVSCWASLAHSLVREGLREWSAYFDTHADDSWSHFEECTRTTDGMILFLIEILKSNPHFYSSHRQTVLKLYLKGMTDLDTDEDNLASLLHLVLDTTSNMDNVCQFIYMGRTRLESITTMIINMQQIWHNSGGADLKSSHSQCRLTSELGHYLIQEMIKSWRFQNHGNMVQRKVDFYSGIIHALLIYLPEYAPYLEFFTKGDQFPYRETAIFVKVYGYSRQLSDGKNVGKAFITYIHSLLENAASAGGENIVTQLILTLGLSPITNDLSDHRIQYAKRVRNGETPHLASAPLSTAVKIREAHQLRQFLLGNVFPPYVLNAFTPTGRLLVPPIIGVLIEVYETLRLDSSQWGDAPQLYQMTRQLLSVCQTTALGSPLRDATSAANVTAAEKRDHERIGESLQHLVDLMEMTVDYMARSYQEEEAGGGEGGEGIVDLRAHSSPAEQEKDLELARYTDRMIEDWKRQVVCRQGGYYVRGKCIGEA